MINALTVGEGKCRLVFDRKMTLQYATEMENAILDALHRFRHVEVDLSHVAEIDMCGMHLLAFLDKFTGHGVVIVAASPEIERVYEARFKHPACAIAARQPAAAATRRWPPALRPGGDGDERRTPPRTLPPRPMPAIMNRS